MYPKNTFYPELQLYSIKYWFLSILYSACASFDPLPVKHWIHFFVNIPKRNDYEKTNYISGSAFLSAHPSGWIARKDELSGCDTQRCECADYQPAGRVESQHFAAVLVEAIKTLKAENDRLKTENEGLKTKLEKYDDRLTKIEGRLNERN